MLNVEASLWGKHARYADVEASDVNTLFYYYTLGLLEQISDAEYNTN